jgi:hypothetical protein
MDPHLGLTNSAAPAAVQSLRAAAARWLNRCSKMLHYAIVFTIISVTMVIMGFGSILGSFWSDDD